MRRTAKLIVVAVVGIGAWFGLSRADDASLRVRTIAVQPYGAVGGDVARQVSDAIRSYYGLSVHVLPSVRMPDTAFYAPRGRYRAERLLDVLDGKGGGYDRVIGVTDRDISTTLHGHEDWGVLGLGRLGGR